MLRTVNQFNNVHGGHAAEFIEQSGFRAAPQIVGQLHKLVSRRGDDTRLTPQQERVLELSAEGLTYREIGARLFISESTVRFHMQKLKGKFGARTKTELIARAIRSGAMAPASEALGAGS